MVALAMALRADMSRRNRRAYPSRATLRKVGSELLDYTIAPEKARQVKFAIAQTFYDEGQYSQAIDRLTAVAYEFPQTPEADAAVQLTLDSYHTLNDFDGLMYASRRLLSEGSPVSAALKAEVQGILAAAEQRKLDELSLQAAGEDGSGLDQLIHFAEQNPGSDVGERALVNAFVAARAVGDTAKVYEMANQLAEKYPQSEQLPGIYKSLAQTANTRFEFDQAIDYLKRAAQVNEGQRTLILAAAAELESQLGRTASAQGTYETAVRQSKEDARDIALSGLAILLERYKSAPEIVSALSAYMASSEPEFQARLGLAYLASGDTEAAEAFIAAPKPQKKSPEQTPGRLFFCDKRSLQGRLEVEAQADRGAVGVGRKVKTNLRIIGMIAGHRATLLGGVGVAVIQKIAAHRQTERGD